MDDRLDLKAYEKKTTERARYANKVGGCTLIATLVLSVIAGFIPPTETFKVVFLEGIVLSLVAVAAIYL